MSFSECWDGEETALIERNPRLVPPRTEAHFYQPPVWGRFDNDNPTFTEIPAVGGEI